MKMAGAAAEGSGFWLPTEFLTDDGFLMDKDNFKMSNNTDSVSEFCFPSEFPYDFETQSDQLLEKFRMMSTSPQSTLTHLGSAGGSSPNGAPSTPTTPFGAKYYAVGDLIHLAAGKVAKLKLNRDYADKSPSLPPRSHTQFSPVCLNAHFQQKQQNEGYRMLYGRQQMGPAAWAPRQNPNRVRAGLSGGSGGGGGTAAKRAGTGVFLPRRYENISNTNAHSLDSHGRLGRAAVQVHPNRSAQSQLLAQAQIIRGFCPDYYSLMARRRDLVLQQRQRLLASLAEGSSMVGRDVYLPHEWSY